MKRGTLIALGLTVGTALFLFSQRKSSAALAPNKPAPTTPTTSTMPVEVTPPPTTPLPTAPAQVVRARALIAKLKHDLFSVTQDEVNEMRGLVSFLRGAFYGYEADNIETLLEVRDAAILRRP